MFPQSGKRFWKDVTTDVQEAGHAVLLDGRPLRTPARTLIVLPTPALAQAVADEWRAVEDRIDPALMPMTRRANAALDRVRGQRAEVVEMLTEYADSDLTCYRALHPEGLVVRQSEAWDPLLEWLERRHGVRLQPRQGVIHDPQDEAAIARLAEIVDAMGVFSLTAFHDLVTLSGSLVIGLAAIDGHAPIDRLWTLSRIDETWQEQFWGVDDEAAAAARYKFGEFTDAFRFHELSQMN